MKKIWKTFLSCFVVFSLLFVNAYSKNDTGDKKNKAIIVVPGVLASGLFYNGKSNLKYSENELLWMGVSGSKAQTLKAASKFLLYYKDLFCDESGIPVNKNIGVSKSTNYVYESDSQTANFGILSLFEKMLGELDKNFGINNGGEYKIVFHSYDWRLDCAENSKFLTKEIMKYDEVILVAHSMGGLVSCKSATELLEKNELHRIKAFVSLGVPYNGATDSLYLLEKGYLTGSPIIDRMSQTMGFPEIIKELACNCVAIYELFPTEEFFKRSNSGFVCSVKNEPLSYEDSIRFTKSRSWAKRSNGLTKGHLERAENFHKSLYINGEHIVNFMNSYFIVGSGLRTMDKILINKDIKNNAAVVSYVDGDGTVALNESAIPSGKSLKDVTKVYCQHTEMVGDELTIKHVVNTIYKKILSESGNSVD